MNWTKQSKYHIESLGNKINATQSVGFSISKSILCGNAIYELWELPYNNTKFIYRSKDLKDVKAQAVQYYQAKLASANSKAA